MIVRILSEGQYALDDSCIVRLNKLDDELQTYLANNDETEFAKVLDQMLALVRAEGRVLSVDDLKPSDAILPPAGSTPADIRAVIDDEGLIPDRW